MTRRRLMMIWGGISLAAVLLAWTAPSFAAVMESEKAPSTRGDWTDHGGPPPPPGDGEGGDEDEVLIRARPAPAPVFDQLPQSRSDRPSVDSLSTLLERFVHNLRAFF